MVLKKNRGETIRRFCKGVVREVGRNQGRMLINNPKKENFKEKVLVNISIRNWYQMTVSNTSKIELGMYFLTM